MQELRNVSMPTSSHDELEGLIVSDNLLIDAEEIEVDIESTKYCP